MSINLCVYTDLDTLIIHVCSPILMDFRIAVIGVVLLLWILLVLFIVDN